MDSAAIPFPFGRTRAELPGDDGSGGYQGSGHAAPSGRPLRLIVRLEDNRRIQLEAFSSDTVLDLKLQVQDRVGLLPDQHRLFFRNIELEDCDTLENCGLTNGCELTIIRPRRAEGSQVKPAASPLEVVFDVVFGALFGGQSGSKKPDSIKLFIRIRRGKCVAVNTCSSATVDSVKLNIEKQTGMPAAWQVLTYGGKGMNNKETLAHYGITNRCVVYLSSRGA